ncbi:MAG TPA: hypothetical protein VMV78_08315 [Thiobacillus sp.]|nr:hypothetical protein [Thiobacillus sp.]
MAGWITYGRVQRLRTGRAYGLGPKTGLSPSWESLKAIDGIDKSSSAPSITEIGGGWYKFSLSYGTAPWDVNELVGVIDADGSLLDAQRYIPVCISLRDMAFAFLANKRQQTIASGMIEIMDDDGSTVMVTYTPSQDSGREVLTPGAPS